MYKKNFLLCTIAGSFVFSHFGLTHANTPPNEIPAIQVKDGEKQTFSNVLVRGKYTAVAVGGAESVATIKKAVVASEMTALSASRAGRIDAKEIDATTLITGLDLSSGVINLEDSTITVKGNHKSYGFVIAKASKFLAKENEFILNKATLTNTKILVKDGIGILGPFDDAEVKLKNSEIISDMLLRNDQSPEIKPSTLTLTADNSILEGRARTTQKHATIFTLNNNSEWYLKISQNETNRAGSSYALVDVNKRAQSIVSILNLNDSSIIFKEPNQLTHYHYQTLNVGQLPPNSEDYEESENFDKSKLEPNRLSPNRLSNVKAVYNATGNADIYFNTKWSDGLAKEQQKTDRLLVYGDVSGTTTIRFKSISKDENAEAKDSIPSNMHGLSLVQVSGQADENSFKLANGYTTIGGLPYKYVLNAYGPTSSHGKASAAQNLLRENKSSWDFRLQSTTLDPEGKIKALVPQVASYLVLSNAVFTAGFADINNQNILLDNMRTTDFGTKDNNRRGIFLSTYGNKVTLSSNRDPLQYGYGADVQHAALQAGVTLVALEEQDITTTFGLLGTYGKLAFTPKDMDGAGKSTLDKGSITAYSSVQHDNGLYVNALLSYGVLKGNITTALIGNTAKLDNANTLSASATIGQKLATDAEGLFFEPQAQLVYQRLRLGTFSDVDGFKVNMGTPHQWLVRVGGRLTQTILPSKEGCPLSFYGKLNIIKTFGDNGTIQIGDTFHLDSMGTSIEGGLGVNAHLTQNAVLHANVNYQHKLQKAGASGINFSGGIQYRF
ncbi:autotransporter outer membrane beta-barrel domain-containing protein [Bartonella jaculi]|uniref:Autotransporter domain-containing protein n=1 Tax=Bartonella jaculi TaxID=686226 RepID=A0ABP9N270_9HYPH